MLSMISSRLFICRLAVPRAALYLSRSSIARVNLPCRAAFWARKLLTRSQLRPVNCFSFSLRSSSSKSFSKIFLLISADSARISPFSISSLSTWSLRDAFSSLMIFSMACSCFSFCLAVALYAVNCPLSSRYSGDSYPPPQDFCVKTMTISPTITRATRR